MKTPTIVLFLAALLTACSPGSIDVKRPDGTTVRVTQPPKAIAPATLAWGQTEGTGTQPGSVTRSESLTIGTGEGAAPPSPAERAMGNLVWLGAALLVAGALIVFVPYLQFIPKDFGLILMAVGVGLIALPAILDKYLTWILLGGLAYLLVRSGMLAKGLDWFKKETGPEAQQRLQRKGQWKAAGALAMVHTRDKDKAKIVSTPPSPPDSSALGSASSSQ